jgi:hypothetical protein
MPTPQNPSDVQVQPNSTGQAIETVLVTQAVTGVTVGRQVVVLGDPNVGGSVATVTTASALNVTDLYDAPRLDLLIELIAQVKINNQLMVSAFNLKDDLVKLDAQFVSDLRAQYLGQVNR